MLLEPRTHLRIDKNFAHNIIDLRKYSAFDKSIIKCLIVYMSFHNQKDLFGYAPLDPYDFGKIMGFTRQKLFEVHKDPIFFKIASKPKEELIELENTYGDDSEYKIWDTNLENALMALKTERIMSSYLTKDENSKTVEIFDFQYIKGLKFRTKRTGKTKKYIYYYKLTDEFERSLKKFFVNSSLDTYLILKKKNLDDFYLNLLNRIQSLNAKGINLLKLEIQVIADFMNISIKTINDENGFSDIKKKVNNKFKIFDSNIPDSEIPGLKLNWEKGFKSKRNNMAVISWFKKSSNQIKKENNVIYSDVFYTELYKKLTFFFYETHIKFDADKVSYTNKFIKWLFSYEDLEIKRANYVAVFAEIRGVVPELETRAEEYFSLFTDLTKAHMDHKLLTYTKDDEYNLVTNLEGKIQRYSNLKNALFELQENKKYFRSIFFK